MKDIDETYFNKENLNVHHDKHVAKDESDYKGCYEKSN